MIRRYKYRRGGCGGRGIGRGSSTPKKIHTKKIVGDYIFYVVSSKQAWDYEIMDGLIFGHIKNTFDHGNNVAEALQTLVKSDTDVWNSTLKSSFYLDATITEIEYKPFLI